MRPPCWSTTISPSPILWRMAFRVLFAAYGLFGPSQIDGAFFYDSRLFSERCFRPSQINGTFFRDSRLFSERCFRLREVSGQLTASRLSVGKASCLGVTIVIFLVMRIIPGDVLFVVFGEEGGGSVREVDRERIEDQLGLNKPLYQQYGNWIKDIFTGTLGKSFWRANTVADLIKRRGPITAEIAIMAVIISWLVGLPAGIISALKQNSVVDYLSRFLTILFLAIPNFWVGAVIVLVLLKAFSWHSPLGIITIWDDPVGNMQIVLGPAIVLGLSTSAYIARMTRSSLLEVIREDYIRTARAKGLTERMVMLRHALRNALLPVVTLSGILLGYLLGGSVAVELAFGVPGLGTSLIQAFTDRDYVVIQNLVLLYATVFVVINLLIDLSYGWLDPRIRFN